MELKKILQSVAILSEQWNVPWEYPIKVRVNGKLYDIKESVSVTEVNGEMCWILETEKDEDKSNVQVSG